jgi:hypothetical protein
VEVFRDTLNGYLKAVMDNFRTNIVLVPAANGFEKGCAIFLAAFIFIPFIFGFFLDNKLLFLSLPIGICLLLIFNLATGQKFVPGKWIQNDSFVVFDLDGVKIINGAQQKDFPWSTLEGTHILIEGYDGEMKQDGESSYSGTENKITFNAGGIKHEFNFYLKNTEQKEMFQRFLQKEELDTSNARLTFKDKLGSHTLDIKSFKQRTEKPEEPKNKKKAIGCLVLFFTPFVLIGLGTLIFSMYQFGKVLQAGLWKPVDAKVLSVELVSSSDSDGTSYKVKMAYEYVMKGTSFKGNSVSFDAGMNNIENHFALHDKLNRSQVVQVYVNENNPGESVVIRGVTNAMIGMVIFSIMWNTLLLNFLLPFFFKQLKIKKLMAITFVVWALGFSKFIFHIGDIDISEQVVVVEAKESRD